MYMKIVRLFILCLIIMLGLGLFTVTVRASEGQNQFKIGDDLFVAGDSITIDEDVVGDLFVAGQNLRLHSRVGGDLFFGGRDVTIDGEVVGSVRGAAQSININGSVGRTIMVGGQNININAGREAQVGNVMVGGATINLDRPIAGYLVAGAQYLNLNQPVAGEAKLAATNVEVGSNSSLLGQVSYYRNSADKNKDEQNIAKLQAITQDKAGFMVLTPPHYGYNFQYSVLSSLLRVFHLVIFGLLVWWLIPKLMQRLTQVQQQSFWLTLLMGIASLPLLIVLIGVLAITVILAPFIFYLLLLLPILLSLASASVYQSVGQRVMYKRGAKPGWDILVGGVIFLAISIVPIVGPLVMLLVAVFGLGSIIVVCLRRLKVLPV